MDAQRLRVRHVGRVARQPQTRKADVQENHTQLVLPRANVKYGDTRLPNRFWSKTQPDPSGCWVWMAAHYRSGYARFAWLGQSRPAHRVVFAELVAPIPEGYHVHHQCRVKNCVNPAHLFALHPVEHRAEHFYRHTSRRTHCANGHPWTPETTAHAADGHRLCRICRREQGKRSREKHGARWLAKARERYRNDPEYREKLREYARTRRAADIDSAREKGREAMARRRAAIDAQRGGPPHRTGAPWSLDDVATAVSMREAGRPWRDIAVSIGRSEAACITKVLPIIRGRQ